MSYRMDPELTPYNHLDVDLSNLPKEVRVADCTLRDGEQQAGLAMSPETKLKIARVLSDLGVYEIEAGMPAVSAEDRAAVEAIVGANLRSKISALARALPADIDAVAASGCWGVRVSLPAGILQLKYKLRMTPREYVEKALAMTAYAKEKGLYVVFSPFDTTRTDEQFLRGVVRELGRTGTVDRFRLVDTTGSATPHAMRYLARLIREESGGVAVEAHTHDDLGLAAANILAAVEAGAEYVSTTMNGLGERAGNAATEQVATALEALYGVSTGIALAHLTEASRTISWLTRTMLPPNTPIVGTNAFAHESGLVVGGILKEPRTGEPMPPETVGQKRRIVIGKGSGAESIRHGLAAMGVEADDASVLAVLQAAKQKASFLERALTDEEFQTVARHTLGRP